MLGVVFPSSPDKASRILDKERFLKASQKNISELF